MVRPAAIQTRDLHCSYGEVQALRRQPGDPPERDLRDHRACQQRKTTFLRSLNRLNSPNVSYRQTA